MPTIANARKGMLTILGLFTLLLIYKVLVYGTKEALRLLPLVGIWLAVTILFWVVTRHRHQAGA